jgi:hypothetical protein
MDSDCLTFEPLYMERVWGGRKLAALFGRHLPVAKPIGESWELVDRADAQSIVSEGRLKGIALHELWLNHRIQIFGEGYDQERFPLLIKILDASDALSVQVHPPIHRKIEFLDEPKTELWYFVATDEGVSAYVGLKNGAMKEDFQSALANGTVDRLLHRLPTHPAASCSCRAAVCTPSVLETCFLRFNRTVIPPIGFSTGIGSDSTESPEPFTSNNPCNASISTISSRRWAKASMRDLSHTIA